MSNRRAGSRMIRLPGVGAFTDGGMMNILVVGGDSAEIFRQHAARRHGQVEHWSGRKTRDLAKPIPIHTKAVVVVLDRISHALARKIRTEATQRGLPVFFQRGGRQAGLADPDPLNLAQWLSKTSESNVGSFDT